MKGKAYEERADFEGIIERVDFPNKGLVKVEEEGKDARYVTVKNAVPGQKVRFIINKFEKRECRRQAVRSSGKFLS